MRSRRPYRTRRATAALEFAILAPTFMLFLVAVLGAGLDGLFQMALDDSVRNAARQVQIDGPASTSAANFISAVCSEFGILAPKCTSALTYDIQASTSQSGFSALSPVVLPASGQLNNAFFSGTPFAANINVLVQVASPLPFNLPFFSTLITGTGTKSILATTVVRVEPF